VIHMVGHALLRMGQFLRAPSALQEAHQLRSGAGGELPTGGGWVERLPFALQLKLYRWSLVEFHFDGLLMRGVVRPLLSLAERLDRLDRRITRQPDTEGSAR
jgi:hypothetical protein